MTNLIATKAGLSSNNSFLQNTISNLPYYVNTSDQLINKANVDTKFTTLLSNSSTFTGSNIFNGTSNLINNLYSNILSINNGTALRAANDLFNISISRTENYLYFNSASVFGHINNSNNLLSWYINSSGVSTLSNLAIGSSSMRTSTDRLNVSITSTGPYMIFNDGGTLGIYNTNVRVY